MKKLYAIVFLLAVIPVWSYSQVRITKATQQKRWEGRGGISMKYVIGLASKANDSLMIDSVKTNEANKLLTFYLDTTGNTYCEFSFGYIISGGDQCGVCPLVTIQPPPNMKKGVVVYFRKKNKPYTLRVKKFKLLPDLMTP